MKQLTGKWKIKKDGSMVMKWKKRKDGAGNVRWDINPDRWSFSHEYIGHSGTN